MDEGTSDVHQVYERSLRSLRRDMGCTPERLIQYPELLSGLGGRVIGQSDDTPVSECINELQQIVDNLGDPKFRESLLVAFRLSTEHQGRTLTERRKSYSDALQQARSPLAGDVRTLERRENRGIALIAQILASKRRPNRPPSPTSDVPASAASAFPHDLAVEAITHSYHFSEEGVMTSKEVTRWVRATASEADNRLLVSSRYLSESRPGVIRLESIDGCRVINQREGSGGRVWTTLEILKRLSPEDGLYPFSCRMLVDSHVRCEPVVNWSPRVHPARHIEFRLSFDAAMTPVRAWWFGGAFGTEGELEPSSGERELDILASGQYIYKIFEGEIQPSGRDYGVAWRWP